MSTVPVSLDRLSFDIEVTHLALKVKPSLCNHYQTEWKNFLFKRPKMRCVYNTPDNKFRLVVLKEEFQDPTLAFAPVSLRDEHFANGDGVELHKIRLGYEHFSVDEVLRRLLPATISEIPSSFEQAGHIAHVNLRDEALPYKKLIGSVIVDKNPNIRTVVNKVGQIETEYRTFPLEVIAGDDDMMVTLKESNASFTFNFAEVYWNSR
jgi:tRNA (guanine37-N1)-methyltransferase